MNTLELKVDCPYCRPIGYAVVIGVQDAQGTVQVKGIKEPRECNFCHRYFALRPRVVFDGVKLEEAGIVKQEVLV